MSSIPPTPLQPDRLMSHLYALCKGIGPRPPTSPQERQAAGYVKKTLGQLGYAEVQEQAFKSPSSLGWVIVICLLAAALAIPLAWAGGQWGKFAGGVLLVGSAIVLRGFFLAKFPFFQNLIARGDSQNLSLHVPPSGPEKRRVYLIGHLDTQKQRYLSPPPATGWMVVNGTLLILVPLLAGILLFLEFLLGWQGAAWWGWLAFALILFTLLAFLSDEIRPHVEGANDNASAVSVLLGIAEALKTQPVQHAGVTLLFTGCEEVICVGMEHYLRRFKPPRENTFWIDLEMVGTGDLCYVTRHGISYLTRYEPAVEMVALATRTAQKHPELVVTGKDVVILEEVANLCNHGYQAICLTSYDQKGNLANWHRLSDNLEHIQPDTLSRAASFTWALVQEIDAL